MITELRMETLASAIPAYEQEEYNLFSQEELMELFYEKFPERKNWEIQIYPARIKVWKYLTEEEYFIKDKEKT